MKAVYGVDFIAINGGNCAVGVAFFDSSTPANCVDVQNLMFDMGDATDSASMETAIIAVINTYATAQSYTLSDGIVGLFNSDLNLPMIVGGVAKTNTYSVAAAPTVAGGAGVVRFYTDSNGDGTGTAPSEIELFTLQAYVVNTSAVYVIGSISVDTNRKYIDITMKSLAFTTGLAGLLNVITGASLANAANGTAVNCLVTVKK